MLQDYSTMYLYPSALALSIDNVIGPPSAAYLSLNSYLYRLRLSQHRQFLVSAC